MVGIERARECFLSHCVICSWWCAGWNPWLFLESLVGGKDGGKVGRVRLVCYVGT